MGVVPYAGTKISVSTRAFTMSANISKEAQKNLIDSTHTIDRTILMHMMIPYSYGNYGTRYLNETTLDVRKVLMWYASSSFETRMGYCGVFLPDILEDAWESFTKLH